MEEHITLSFDDLILISIFTNPSEYLIKSFQPISRQRYVALLSFSLPIEVACKEFFYGLIGILGLFARRYLVNILIKNDVTCIPANWLIINISPSTNCCFNDYK